MTTTFNHISNPYEEKRPFSLDSSLTSLREILSTQGSGSKEAFYEIVQELEQFRDKFCNKLANQPQKLFEQLKEFLNYDLLLLLRRKFYNNAPDIDLEAFAMSSLANQYLNNMLNPEHTMEGEYYGGSCFHWSIFLKKFIDSRKIKGLNTQIVKYHNGTHSFVLLSFKGKSYKAEVNGKDNRILQPFGEYYEIDKNIPLIPNMLKVNELRGQKEEIKCMYVNKEGEEHIVTIEKDTLEISVGESFLHYKIGAISPQTLVGCSSPEIMEYLLQHSQLIKQDVSEYAEDELLIIASSMISKVKAEEIRNLFN